MRSTQILLDDTDSGDSEISFDVTRPEQLQSPISNDCSSTSDDGDDHEISPDQGSVPDPLQLPHPLAHSSPVSSRSPSPTQSDDSPRSTRSTSSSKQPAFTSRRITTRIALLPRVPQRTPLSAQRSTLPSKPTPSTATQTLAAINALLAETKRTNNLLQTIVNLKEAKYTAFGYFKWAFSVDILHFLIISIH